jgi:hypothetical protein
MTELATLLPWLDRFITGTLLGGRAIEGRGIWGACVAVITGPLGGDLLVFSIVFWHEGEVAILL